jgi:hypothetical protein
MAPTHRRRTDQAHPSPSHPYNLRTLAGRARNPNKISASKLNADDILYMLMCSLLLLYYMHMLCSLFYSRYQKREDLICERRRQDQGVRG